MERERHIHTDLLISKQHVYVENQIFLLRFSKSSQTVDSDVSDLSVINILKAIFLYRETLLIIVAFWNNM